MKEVVLDADVEITDDGKVTNIRSIKDSVGNDVTQDFLAYCKKNKINIKDEGTLREGLHSFGSL
ncbi:hypothetical protein VSVS12_04060 [Vibrio scophthalmi]|uniref:hypothetical protein n=1 Tax=Vibrio scophthalmi TaxID=45658 RepID=UPI0008097893|nr:hypothetical protein [Vibrio scophthalmi]ANS87760.1 hypothetical protein VSVS12_04060 [Vibrio scophthalmi]